MPARRAPRPPHPPFRGAPRLPISRRAPRLPHLREPDAYYVYESDERAPDNSGMFLLILLGALGLLCVLAWGARGAIFAGLGRTAQLIVSNWQPALLGAAADAVTDPPAQIALGLSAAGLIAGVVYGARKRRARRRSTAIPPAS